MVEVGVVHDSGRPLLRRARLEVELLALDEALVGRCVGVSSRWAISLFLIAVVFTGIEFDDLAFGIVLNLEDLSEVALATVIGTTVAMTGIVLALMAIVAPCPVDVPKDYLALFVAAPVVMFGFAVTGALTFDVPRVWRSRVAGFTRSRCCGASRTRWV